MVIYDKAMPPETVKCPFCSYNPLMRPVTTSDEMLVVLGLLNAHLLVHVIAETRKRAAPVA